MRAEMSRRTALAGGIALAAGYVARSSETVAVAAAGPSIIWHPVTPSRIAVLVSGGSGTMHLKSATGQLLAAGTGCLNATVATNATSRLVLTVGAGTFPLTVSTAAAALAASPWRVCNKRNALPSTYVPALVVSTGSYRLRADCAAAYGNLRRGALAAGYRTGFTSAYRSYAGQQSLYASYLRSLGKVEADRRCARAGFSEHQLGLAIDLAGASSGSGLARWVQGHAATYGFVVRYRQNCEAVTGFEYEPWHVRYVGPTMANDYARRGYSTLEAYFGLPAAPTY